VNFQLTAEQKWLQCKCRALAADFATRSAAHDRDASHPVENYRRLREEGFLALTIGKEWGGRGASLLDHTIAYEALGAGCPSTALAFNMHASVVMPVLESPEVAAATKRWLADLVVREGKLIAGNFSEPITTALIAERPIKTRARRVEGGYCVTGRKMFASMIEAADFVMGLPLRGRRVRWPASSFCCRREPRGGVSTQTGMSSACAPRAVTL
jgi:alkylation response protein AidB-like acyl-CoA dehydrogenase